MEVDYFSYIELTKLLLPHFIARQNGHFVVTSGFMGKIAMPLRSGYCAAKFALHGFFDSLRAEVKGQNINVTLLIPGAMRTNLVKKTQQYNPQENEEKAFSSQLGCDVTKAAKQSINAIKNKKFEAYIGDYDKSTVMLILHKFCPNLVKKLIIKKA